MGKWGTASSESRLRAAEKTSAMSGLGKAQTLWVPRPSSFVVPRSPTKSCSPAAPPPSFSTYFPYPPIAHLQLDCIPSQMPNGPNLS